MAPTSPPTAGRPGTMAGLDAGPAIPVWLAEDDLGCIICHDLLAWPATLPCGHTFCRDCLLDLWAASRGRFCPTCREGAPRPPQLRKNTMLEALADKYRLAARELEGLSPYPVPEPGPAPRPAPRPGRPTAQLRVGRRDQRLPSALRSSAPPAPRYPQGASSLPVCFSFHFSFLRLYIEPVLWKVQRNMKKQEKKNPSLKSYQLKCYLPWTISTYFQSFCSLSDDF